MFRLLSIFAALLCVAAPAGAAGVVSFSWDGCTGPLSRTVLPGSQPALYASLIGQAESHRGYQLRVVVSTGCANPGSGLFPDAWRFEDGGCQPTGSFTNDHVAPPEVAASCPSFKPASMPAFIIKSYVYDAVLGRATINLAIIGADDQAVPVDPNVRYFLGRFVFDQGQGIVGPSVPGFCGGLETALCFQPTELLWLNSAADALTWQTDTPCLTVNDPAGTSGCNLPTPVRATTWGAIRGQYR